jgi:guanine deaminase
MRRAIELSRVHMEAGEGGPFGAVVVKDGQIVGEGWNRVTSTYDPTAHAEVVAIRLACEQLETFTLKGCEIYTSCEPCPMCLAAIYWARLDRIWYANNQADAAAIQFDDEPGYTGRWHCRFQSGAFQLRNSCGMRPSSSSRPGRRRPTGPATDHLWVPLPLDLNATCFH